MSEIEKWLMGIVAAMLVAGIGNYMRVIHQDVKDIGEKLEEIRQDLSSSLVFNAKLDERLNSYAQRMETLERWVDEISKKCERVTLKYHGVQGDERHAG